MTRDEMMKLKKPELRMALDKELTRTANMKDYLANKREELRKCREGLAEIQKAFDLTLMKVALTYGGDDHTIVLHKMDLDGWTADVDRDPETGAITIRARKKAKMIEPDGNGFRVEVKKEDGV